MGSKLIVVGEEGKLLNGFSINQDIVLRPTLTLETLSHLRYAYPSSPQGPRWFPLPPDRFRLR